jgi:hypothetical protein
VLVSFDGFPARGRHPGTSVLLNVQTISDFVHLLNPSGRNQDDDGIGENQSG